MKTEAKVLTTLNDIAPLYCEETKSETVFVKLGTVLPNTTLDDLLKEDNK